MEDYEIVGWPDIQDIMDKEGFEDNATLITPNDSMGIGSSTYLVDKGWLYCLDISESEVENIINLCGWFSTGLKELNLPKRTINCLQRKGINTIGDVAKQRKEDLLQIRNFGSLSINEIECVLETLGLDFGTDVDRYYKQLELLTNYTNKKSFKQ